MSSSISRRASRLSAGGMAPYIAAHFDRVNRPPEAGTESYIGLCIAENKQMWDLLGPRLAGAHDLDASVTGYDNMSGSVEFRSQIARLLGTRVFRRELDPESVVTMAGAGAILEALFFVLAGPGEGVIVPTPSYSGFWPDLQGRAECVIVPAHTSAENGFELTTAVLDDALAAATVPVRAMLYTNPDNPLGRVASRAQVEQVREWCTRHQIHLVVDEIYALSVFGDAGFESVGVNPLGDSVHVVWAFSKDFSVSGLRCGVLVSENDEVRRAVAAQTVWGSVSTLTQAVVADIISDDDWLDSYLEEMPRRLGTIYRSLVPLLDRAGIPYVHSDAGFFLLLDLRGFLDEPTWEAEDGLWQRMLDEAGVNLTPGSACHIAEPGFFRLCFAAAAPSRVVEAVSRLARLLIDQSGS